MGAQMRGLLQHVGLASEHLGFLLIQHGLLQRHPPLSQESPAAAASPSERGEGLVSALIAIGAS